MPDPFAAVLAAKRNKLDAALAAIPAKAGAIIVEHSDKAFVEGGWTDHSFEPWDARQSKAAKYEGRAILYKTGNLRRSVRVISTTRDSVSVGTDVPYAKIHNEGGTINYPARDATLNFDRTPANGLWRFGKVRTIRQQRGIKAIRRVTIKAHSTKMPKRKFLGESYQQTQEIRTMIYTDIANAFK